MKKLISKFPILMIMMLFFISCGKSNTSESTTEKSTESAKKVENEKKTLLVYYSHTGTVDKIVEKIKGKANVDAVKIEMVTEMTQEQLQNELPKLLEEKFRPEIKKADVDVSKYDLIIVGTPTWNGNVALPLLTFLESNNFKDKEVTAFAAYGQNPGTILENFESSVKDAKIKKGITLKKSDVDEDKIDADLDTWLGTLK